MYLIFSRDAASYLHGVPAPVSWAGSESLIYLAKRSRSFCCSRRMAITLCASNAAEPGV
jgi:hypothetical protein